MNAKKFVAILKEGSEAYVSKDDKFIKIIAEFMHINDMCILNPNYIHIVNDSFVNIDEKVRIDLEDIKEVMVL